MRDGRVQAPLARRALRVLDNRPSGSYRVFSVIDPLGPEPRAGQFAMIAARRGWGADGDRPYLPRAFSVAMAHRLEAGVRLDFLVEDVGPGTERLASLEPGEELWTVGPLGRPFTEPEALAPRSSQAILVGGGIGVAPLALWERRLQGMDVDTVVLLGFRDRAHAGGIDLFSGEVEPATEDGHLGHKGLVTELLAPRLTDGAACVYACGPPAMLEAVRALCAERSTPCELAMESGMACGYGACFGCAVPTRAGYVRLCVDGPVLDAADLDSALVPGAGH